MKPKVLITREFIPEVIEYLKKHVELEIGAINRGLLKEELIEKIKDKEGIICLLTDRIDKEIMDSAPRLKIIANCAVGYDNIDVGYAKAKGIYVTNTPGVLTEATADLTWALILAVARRIPQADLFTRQKKFKGWSLTLFLGKEIFGKKLGIIGLGRIGKAVAKRAKGFNMEVFYYDIKRIPEREEKELNVSYLSLDELLRNSDIVTIHTSLNETSYHLISAEKIKLLKKDAILVNVARGPVIDEEALATALEEGKIWGAGLDVYENEPQINEKLLKLENVILLPHIGSATEETRYKMAMTAAENLLLALHGKKPKNLVW
ncbi:D-glycerate dehydrogenase [Candidatus Aminicenantes bacterium AC-335-B20]|nr:D-glycerate dehydrogenase [SCandidatus Aminicenantes bacterium Aminicenantia_JdfR_composite]MCP2597557.1 D-glycerate dehydrogenase [Candidatus Aminicenantes bacterium AC-335-G13]MCP2599187.1 D-glycerate dehydrogenase [Candidatus Aminicenantes bacterium AC-335-B20]MCP2605516.1 D-glycerate dehydrogenase [Candidatus Aminicenantes bacterium AC-335-O07]MCP2619152.1 D-glycerate dehydrogenase [Candidatus Aminicenantes bacterium AC-335-K20]